MSLTELIKTRRPHLSSSSVRTYNSILTNLAKKIDTTDKLDRDGIIKHSDAITKRLKDDPPKNRKTILSALVVVLDEPNSPNNDVLNHFRRQMLDDSKKSDEIDNKQEMSEKQAENWIEWKDVIAKYEDMKKKVAPLWKTEHLTKSMFRLLQQYVILSLFVLIKPRRALDWVDFKLRNIDNKKDNYMQGNKLYFNSFKTKKYLGLQTVELPATLKKILSDWSKIQKSDYLLTDTRGSHMNSSKFTNELYSIFDPKLISVNMLRHSYLTSLLKDVPKLQELQETMKDMGQTDLETQMKYVKKEPTRTIKKNKK